MSASQQTSSKTSSSKLGRSIAFTLYFAALAYAIGVGFISIVPQVFPSMAKHEPIDPSACTDTVQQLYDDLQVFHQAVVNTTTNSQALAHNFFGRWDERAGVLTTPPCDKHQVALLRRLRYRSELSILNYMRHEAPLAASVRTQIEPHGQ